jgi:hypothetical protein
VSGRSPAPDVGSRGPRASRAPAEGRAQPLPDLDRAVEAVLVADAASLSAEPLDATDPAAKAEAMRIAFDEHGRASARS